MFRTCRGGRIDLALGLLRQATQAPTHTIVVAGAAYGGQRSFVAALADAGFEFALQVRPSSRVHSPDDRNAGPIRGWLQNTTWRGARLPMPDGRVTSYSVAVLGDVRLSNGDVGVAFAGQSGGIMGVHRGTILGVASFRGSARELVQLAAYASWIRPQHRVERRSSIGAARAADRLGSTSTITIRSNIAVGRSQDQRAMVPKDGGRQRGKLPKTRRLRVVELFSGAGGMGLGFLLAGSGRRTYKLVCSAEVNPIYVQTLVQNHARLPAGRVPARTVPLDLRTTAAAEEVAGVVANEGGVDVVIGGPPCQGFSMANRNSWSGRNPNNRLVDVFFQYVKRLQPPVFLMENVQGILWTPGKGGGPAVIDSLEHRLQRAGYVLFPKLLDAVWYGVPQHRTRFFLLGLHRDLGYALDDFGEWGPFPRPTHGPGLKPLVTVRDALQDLPRLRNGGGSDEARYQPGKRVRRSNAFLKFCRTGASPGLIHDHVTSTHADYVLDRFRRIPPGGNWRDIVDDLTNYAEVSRTHSNIYRRLCWVEPSVTIGHYRKSMLVHPSQNRGLSLREAARLQSFPDWFRFVGTTDGTPGGLMHKQQQLANAVCPLVTKAVAEHILRL